MTDKTLWIGDLESWMDENYIKTLFKKYGEHVTVKIIRDKTQVKASGYGFIEFATPSAAERLLSQLNGTMIPNTNMYFKLNKASHSQKGGDGEFSVFVGDLANDVDDFGLLQCFQARYMSVKSAKVVTDPITGASKNYGFVKFGDELEQQRSMMEMQGVVCGSRPIRVSAATPKYRQNYSNIQLSKPTITTASTFIPNVYVGPVEPDATVYVGNIPVTTTEQDIQEFFAGYSDIIGIKIPPARNCAFVQFAQRKNAEMAIMNMNGFIMGGARVKLSWGKGSGPAFNPNPQQQPQQVQSQAQDYYSLASAAAQLPFVPMVQNGYPTPVNPMAMNGYPVAAPVIDYGVDPLMPIKVEEANAEFMLEKQQYLTFGCISEGWS